MISPYHKYPANPHVLVILILFLTPLPMMAQLMNIDGYQENQLRLLQLLDHDLPTSFTNRPYDLSIFPDTIINSVAELPGYFSYSTGVSTSLLGDKANLTYYPLHFRETFNSEFPKSENNEAAWWGRGWNTELLGGISVTAPHFRITLRPQITYQQNRSFNVPRFIPRDEQGNILYMAEGNLNLDAPFRFGNSPYWTTSWGMSDISVHYGPIELGYGTTPRWWGPSQNYALMLSNNAPGFRHLHFGSRIPINLPLNMGRIEFNYIAGKPEGTSYFQKSTTDSTRFATAVHVNYSPSFIPNLHIGLIRFYHTYIDDKPAIADYLIMFEPFQKKKLFDDRYPRGDGYNQIASIYARWLFPKSNAEIYLEYAKEDHHYDLRDLLMEPNHIRAYTIGLRKLFTDMYFDLVDFRFELNQLEAPSISQVRNQSYFYVHSRVQHGHTNEGQILGAAIGPGSNSQYLGVDFYKWDGMAGLFVQREDDNNNFHYRWLAARDLRDPKRHRVNLNLGFKAGYRWNGWLAQTRLIWTRAYNYGRYDYGEPNVHFDKLDPYDLDNWQLQFSLRYLF
ncbi:MAG: capsule assembly Wzi family protein [Bacteroidota bacterium]